MQRRPLTYAWILPFVLLTLAGFACAPREVARPVPPSVATPATPVPPVVGSTAPAFKLPSPSAPVLHHLVVLPVPFTPQAPYANWALPYQEACEEASMVMAVEFFNGNKNEQLAPAYADEQILQLVEWEKANLGFYEDTTAAEVVGILKKDYKLQAEVVAYDPTAIREAIIARKLVLLPAAGQLLGNPYFTQRGPLYHMLVVRGYEGNEFITNDPGTRRGAGLRYTEAVLARAVHDWNGGDVVHGQQVMVVVSN